LSHLIGGWYSFNGGSAFAATAQAAQALLNTHIAACTSAATWVILSRIKDKDKWHLTEIMNGVSFFFTKLISDIFTPC
jgi:Amt family ammonium transporter